MNKTEIELIESWQGDQSFNNWAKGINEVDLAHWDAYFVSHPEHLEIAEVAKFALINIQSKQISSNSAQAEVALNKLKSRIEIQDNHETNRGKSFKLAPKWKVAASLIVLLSIAFWSYTHMDAPSYDAGWTTEDFKKEYLLEDGSKVTLNKYSTLSYDSGNPRDVNLEGEAFFEVAKDEASNSKFTVTTNDLIVNVLGTEFNVNTQKGNTEVYLDEGKVKLILGDNGSEEMEMQPGELVTYSKNEERVLEHVKSMALKHIGWKEDVFFFDDSSMSEVIKTVQELYGITFDQSRLEDHEETFTGGIPMEDLGITLETIKNIFHIDIQQSESKYLLID